MQDLPDGWLDHVHQTAEGMKVEHVITEQEVISMANPRILFSCVTLLKMLPSSTF
jgi:hypothetical protein